MVKSRQVLCQQGHPTDTDGRAHAKAPTRHPTRSPATSMTAHHDTPVGVGVRVGGCLEQPESAPSGSSDAVAVLAPVNAAATNVAGEAAAAGQCSSTASQAAAGQCSSTASEENIFEAAKPQHEVCVVRGRHSRIRGHAEEDDEASPRPKRSKPIIVRFHWDRLSSSWYVPSAPPRPAGRPCP